MNLEDRGIRHLARGIIDVDMVEVRVNGGSFRVRLLSHPHRRVGRPWPQMVDIKARRDIADCSDDTAAAAGLRFSLILKVFSMMIICQDVATAALAARRPAAIRPTYVGSNR
ncbi:hypothetical protein [Actinomadura sp. 7K507]|uniref:hypothetical protein n=1 Tax=Actinomadura sp. 7K507 TaxID=2530365 RepID=UPI001404C074|nr:hypothetical protein [Actinomadura sp. 7K507]